MRDAALDLVLGSTCVGCGRSGRMLCSGCRVALPREPRVLWPSPAPPGLVTPWSVADYEGAIRAMIVGHKDRAQFAFRHVLADLLTVAIRAAALPTPGPVVLVPVPSRPGSARRRGHDPLGTLIRLAVRTLRREGYDAASAAILVSSRRVVDQAGLTALERATNLSGSMSCPSLRLAGLARRRSHARLVVCDDVLTTGATVSEAQRALAVVGLTPVAIATIAATRRRNLDQSTRILWVPPQTG